MNKQTKTEAKTMTQNDHIPMDTPGFAPVRVAKCGHDLTGSGFHLIVPSERLDWMAVVAKLRANFLTIAFDHHVRQVQRDCKEPAIQICDDCSRDLPSEKGERLRVEKLGKDRNEKLESDREEKIRETRESGAALYECPGCEILFEEDELVQLRECPHCESTFDGTDNGRNCPECNRPFTRKLTERGCPDCLDGDDLPYSYEEKHEQSQNAV